MVVSPITWYFFADNSSKIGCLVMYHFLSIFIVNLGNVLAQLTWLIVFLAIELPFFFPCICINILCCSKKNNPLPNNQMIVNQNNIQGIGFNQNPPAMQIHFNNRPAGHQIPNGVNQNEDMMPNMMNLFNLMIMQYNMNNQRLGEEVNAFQAILLHWKRQYLATDVESNPNCCVCLDNFNIGEDVVELHCNPGYFGHIFHCECIRDWSLKQRTCPLCRKDFVELIKQEKEKGLIKENIVEEEKLPANLVVEGNYRRPDQEVVQEVRQFNRILLNNHQYRADEVDEEDDNRSLMNNQNGNQIQNNVLPPLNNPRARIILPPIQRANSLLVHNNIDNERMNMSI